MCVCVCTLERTGGCATGIYLSVWFSSVMPCTRPDWAAATGWAGKAHVAKDKLARRRPLAGKKSRPGLPKRQCKSSTCADALYMRLVAILTPLTSCCSSHPHPPGFAAVTSLLLCCAYRSTHQHTSICKHLLMCGYHTTQPLLPCSTVQLPAMHTLT